MVGLELAATHILYLGSPMNCVVAGGVVGAPGAGHVLHADAKGGDELLHKVEHVRCDGRVAYRSPTLKDD